MWGQCLGSMAPERPLVSGVRTDDGLVDRKGHTSTSGRGEGHSCPEHHTLVTQHTLPSPTGPSSGPGLFRPHPDPATSQADALTGSLLMLNHSHLQKDRARPGEGLSAAPRMGSGRGRRKRNWLLWAPPVTSSCHPDQEGMASSRV